MCTPTRAQKGMAIMNRLYTIIMLCGASQAAPAPCTVYKIGANTTIQAKNSIEAAKQPSTGVDVNGYFCPAPAATLYDNSKKRPYVGVQLVHVFNESTDTHYYKYGTPNYFSTPEDNPEQSQPCDCYSQPIKWAAEHLDLDNDNAQGFVRYMKGRHPDIQSWDPKTQGSPCDYVELGTLSIET